MLFSTEISADPNQRCWDMADLR